MMTNYAPMLDFAGSILYLAALLGDRPRSIDQYIDYFGDGTERAGRSESALSTRLAIGVRPALPRQSRPIGDSGT